MYSTLVMLNGVIMLHCKQRKSYFDKKRFYNAINGHRNGFDSLINQRALFHTTTHTNTHTHTYGGTGNTILQNGHRNFCFSLPQEEFQLKL